MRERGQRYTERSLVTVEGRKEESMRGKVGGLNWNLEGISVGTSRGRDGLNSDSASKNNGVNVIE